MIFGLLVALIGAYMVNEDHENPAAWTFLVCGFLYSFANY